MAKNIVPGYIDSQYRHRLGHATYDTLFLAISSHTAKNTRYAELVIRERLVVTHLERSVQFCDVTLTVRRPGMGSNGVTVTKFLQLLMILELYLELNYLLSQIFIVVTAPEAT